MSEEQKPLQIGSGLDDMVFEAPATEVKGSATASSVREAMGNQVPKLPRIEVKHAGAVIFKEKDGQKRQFQSLTGVIVGFTKHNSFFGVEFEKREIGQRPKCYSNDGVTISPNAPEPQAPGVGCQGCFRNRDAERGSDARKRAFELDRKTENCNNYLTLVMIVKGQGEIPFAIQMPNSSFDAWSGYAQELYSAGRFNPHEVVTEITLVEEKKKGWTNSASVARFKKLVAIPVEKRPAYEEQHTNWTAFLKSRSEHGAEGGADNAGNAADAVRRAKEAEGAGADAGL